MAKRYSSKEKYGWSGTEMLLQLELLRDTGIDLDYVEVTSTEMAQVEVEWSVMEPASEERDRLAREHESRLTRLALDVERTKDSLKRQEANLQAAKEGKLPF